jgi:hypothetical protein
MNGTERMMPVRAEKIIELLDGTLLSGSFPQEEIQSACGSDMMSDVLAYPKEHMVLLTGLINQHVVRTCEMLDVLMIVFVRGKNPPQDVLDMANELGIAVARTPHTLYESCGRLYRNGLPSGARG